MLSRDMCDLADRAKQYYNEHLKSKLEISHLNAFVAIEPDSGRYFFGKTLTEAAENARTVFPERQTYVLHIGHQAAIHFGVLQIDRQS